MAGGPKPFGNSRLKFQPLRQSKLEKLEVMSATQQYLLLLGLALGILGAVLSLYGLARSVGPTRQEPGKDVPASAGVLSGLRSGDVIMRAITVMHCCFWRSIWRWPTCTLGRLCSRK